MPVTATPLTAQQDPCCGVPAVPVPPTLVPSNCIGQEIISAPVSRVRGRPVLTRMRAVTIPGGKAATIRWQFHDPQGLPVDIRSCVCESSSSSASGDSAACPWQIKLRIQEHLSLGKRSTPTVTLTGTTTDTDAAEGFVNFEVPASVFKLPAVYFAEAALADGEDADATVLFSNIFYLYVGRGGWSGSRPQGSLGPPSIGEVRLRLRDSGGEENYLLDTLKFDDAEIAMVASRCVEEWNETPPNVKRYTTKTFPFRYHWMEGMAAHLFQMAAEQFRANNLKYSAGGVAVDDQDKEGNYERAAQACQEKWQMFVRRKKAEINLGMVNGSVGSAYSRWYGR